MKIHIVQKGDTLWKIAQQYGVDFEQLKAANTHISNPDMIMPGMKIKIPTGSVPVKKEYSTIQAKEKPIFYKEKDVEMKQPTAPKEQVKPQPPKMELPKIPFPPKLEKPQPPKTQPPKKEMPKIPKPPEPPKKEMPQPPKMEMPNVPPKQGKKMKKQEMPCGPWPMPPYWPQAHWQPMPPYSQAPAQAEQGKGANESHPNWQPSYPNEMMPTPPYYPVYPFASPFMPGCTTCGGTGMMMPMMPIAYPQPMPYYNNRGEQTESRNDYQKPYEETDDYDD